MGVQTEKVIIKSRNWQENVDAEVFKALVKPVSIGTALELIETKEDEVDLFECQEEYEIMMQCDSLEAYETLRHKTDEESEYRDCLEHDEYNTDEGLIMSMADPRNYPDGTLHVLEGEAYDEVHVARPMEELMQRIEVALDSGVGPALDRQRGRWQQSRAALRGRWRRPHPK